jgi:hypothetical protein
MWYRLAVALFLLAQALFAQTPESPTAEKEVQARAAEASQLTTNEVTALLEKYLATKRVVAPKVPDGTPLSIDIVLEDKQPVTPPTPPPQPAPPSPPPVGPLPFMPKPPSLEDYREAMETFRITVEQQHDRGEISRATYATAIAEYKRRIELYRLTLKSLQNVKESPR